MQTNSKVALAVSEAELHLEGLRCGLTALASVKTGAANLMVAMKSIQEKRSKLHEILPVLFLVKELMEKAIPMIKSALRAQKQRKLNKLTCKDDYQLVCGNGLGMTWDAAMENTSSTETSGVSAIFTPLSADQLKAFITLKDLCYSKGMCGIPSHTVCDFYNLPNDMHTIHAVMYQLIEVFPLLCIESCHGLH